MAQAETALRVLERPPAEGLTGEPLGSAEDGPGDPLFSSDVGQSGQLPFELDERKSAGLDQCEEFPRLRREPASGPWQHGGPSGPQDYVPVLAGEVVLIESRNHVAKYSRKRVATGDLDRTSVSAGQSVGFTYLRGTKISRPATAHRPRGAAGRQTVAGRRSASAAACVPLRPPGSRGPPATSSAARLPVAGPPGRLPLRERREAPPSRLCPGAVGRDEKTGPLR